MSCKTRGGQGRVSKSLDCSSQETGCIRILNMGSGEKSFHREPGNDEMLLAVQVCVEAADTEGLAYDRLQRMEEDVYLHSFDTPAWIQEMIPYNADQLQFRNR